MTDIYLSGLSKMEGQMMIVKRIPESIINLTKYYSWMNSFKSC